MAKSGNRAESFSEADKLFFGFRLKKFEFSWTWHTDDVLFYNKCVSMIAPASSLAVAKIPAFLVDLTCSRKFAFVGYILPHLAPLISKNWTRDWVKTEMCHKNLQFWMRVWWSQNAKCVCHKQVELSSIKQHF